jgi:glycosyltransferase involved in cell wall biosynthesis
MQITRTKMPLVSIITPVYNGSKYIEELILSVLDQDYASLEHIIIDDGSIDNGATLAILKKYAHIRWWTRANKGAYATINEGLAAATGELVTVICSDDKYASRTALSDAVKLWSSNPDCDAVYGDTIRIDENGRILDDEVPRNVPLCLFRYYPGICHCSLLVNRCVVVGEAILFDERFPYMADYDWIIQLMRRGLRFKRLRKPIAMFRQHAVQRSQDANPVRIEERQRIVLKYGKLNKVILFIVNKWWRLTKLKNLLIRRGPLVCYREINKRLTCDKT